MVSLVLSGYALVEYTQLACATYKSIVACGSVSESDCKQALMAVTARSDSLVYWFYDVFPFSFRFLVHLEPVNAFNTLIYSDDMTGLRLTRFISKHFAVHTWL